MEPRKLARSANAKRNIFFGIVNKMIVLVMPFVMRLVIIRAIGAEYLGLGSLFSSILQVLNMTELGFSSAIIYSMYKPVADNDTKTLGAILNFYKKIYFAIGCIILIAGIVIMPFLPKLISGATPGNINIYILFGIYLINTVVSYWLFAYKNALISAYQRSDILSNINSAVYLCTYLIQFLVIMFTKNYYLYVVVLVFASVAINISVHVTTKKMYPDIISSGEISKSLKKDIVVKVKGLLISKVCVTSRNSFDSIVVSAFLGLIVNAIYNNYYYIMNAVVSLMAIIGVAIQAGVGNSIVIETKEKNFQDMQKLNFIYMWLAGWCTVCLLCLYQPFVRICFGNDMVFPYYIVILFCVYFYVLKMGDIRTVYSDAKGLWWENRYRALIEAISNILLNLILGKFFGVTGIVVATLISLFAFNFLWGSTIIFQYYFTEQSPLQYFKYHFLYALVTVGACLVTGFLCDCIQVDGLRGLIIRGIICVVVPNIYYCICYLGNKKFRDYTYWFIGILRRRAG